MNKWVKRILLFLFDDVVLFVAIIYLLKLAIFGFGERKPMPRVQPEPRKYYNVRDSRGRFAKREDFESRYDETSELDGFENSAVSDEEDEGLD